MSANSLGDPPGLRLATLVAWMANSGIDLSAPLEASLLAGGRSNITYRLVDAEGRTWVLRRPPLGHVLPTAHDMAREFRVISGMNRVGFPAPAALASCAKIEVIGAPFMLMSFIEGRVIDNVKKAHALSPGEAHAVSAELFATMARLHAVDPDAAGLATLGHPSGYLPRQVRRWHRQWDLTRTRQLPSIDALHTELSGRAATVPDDMPWSLVHGDYRLDNLILVADRPEIAAVVDWEMSTLGDPITDLALALVYWTQAGDTLRAQVPIAEHFTDAPGYWTRQRIVDEYSVATGRNLDHLDLAAGVACYKLAVILETIRFRDLSGQQLGSGAEAAVSMGVASEALAELGLAVLRLGAIDGLAS